MALTLGPFVWQSLESGVTSLKDGTEALVEAREVGQLRRERVGRVKGGPV